MKEYIGFKIIKAEPQAGPDGQEGYKVQYPNGYVSWSPKDVFEQVYRPTDWYLNFEHALAYSRLKDVPLRHSSDEPLPDTLLPGLLASYWVVPAGLEAHYKERGLVQEEQAQ